MPEVFRFYGFSFFFYSKEHEPPHIHVEGKGGRGKFRWNGEMFIEEDLINIKPGDLKRIKEVIEENSEIIIRRWNEHFKG